MFAEIIAKHIENSPFRICLKNLNLEYVYANPAALRELGLDPENGDAIRGMTDEDFFTKETVTQKTHDDLRARNGDFVVHKPDMEAWKAPLGEKRSVTLVYTTIYPMHDASGKVEYLLSISCASNRLESRDESGGSSMLDLHDVQRSQSDVAMYMKDIASGQVFENSAFGKLFPEEHPQDRFERIHEEDRQRLVTGLKQASSAPEDRQVILDFRLLKQKGQPGNEDDYATVRASFSKQQIVGRDFLVAIHHSTSGSNLSELIAKRAFESLPGFVFIKDEKYCFRFMNDRLLDYLEVKLEDVIGKPDEKLGFRTEEVSQFREADSMVFDSEEILVVQETLTIKDKDPLKIYTIKFLIEPIFITADSLSSNPEAINLIGISIPTEEIEIR